MSHRIFRPGLIPSLVSLVLFLTFVYLGFWQLERADEVRDLHSKHEQRIDLPTFRLESRVRARDELENRRVFVRGRFDEEHQILINNKVHQGQPGYYVITPLKMVGSDQFVLVNRGWVAAGKTRDNLPEINVTNRHVTIHGVLVKPSIQQDIFMPRDKNRDSRGWPVRLPWLDIKKFIKDTKFDVYPFAILMDADAPHGYVRAWGEINKGSDKSTIYAMRCFSIAVLLFIIYVVVNFRKVNVK